MPYSPTEPALPDLKILDDLEAARALADRERRRLLRALAESADSASGLARRLGESRQRLNYHLRSLEEAGILELHEERRKGNCTERLLRPAARRFLVDPGVLGGPPANDDHPAKREESAGAPIEAGLSGSSGGGGPSDPGAPDRFSATYLVALAARTVGEVGRLMEKARVEGRGLATASLDTTVELPGPRDLPAFLEDLHGAVSEVVARHHAPCEGSRPFRIVVGTHPRGTSPEGRPDHPNEEIET